MAFAAVVAAGVAAAVGLERADRKKCAELRERLAALSEAAEAPAKPATSAGFYGEDELQGILAMHEQVLDVVDSEPAVTEASVFDLHEIVKGMVEGDNAGDG